MRRLITWTTLLAAGASTVSIASGQVSKPQAAPRPAAAAAPRAGAPVAKPATAPAAPLSPEAQKAKAADEVKKREEMNLLLTEWEKESKKVTSLHVVFERIDRSLKWGDQVYQGEAYLKSPDLACLEFKRAVPDAQGKPQFKTDANNQKLLRTEASPFQRIVCTGKEVLQYEWDERAIYIYPLDKEARQKALQQGPLPFLFNMKAADAKKRYGMTLLDQNTDWYLIAIVPREEIDKQSFSQAFVWLNKETFLPNKLFLIPIGEKERQEFRFTAIDRNGKILDGLFNPVTNIPNWKINRNEPDVAPGPKAAPAAPDPVATQPARPAPTASGKRVTPQAAARTAGRP